MKATIFDSSTLISIAMNGLLEEVILLKKIFNGKFLITEEVRKEIIETPLNTKRFKLEALQIKKLLDSGIIEMPNSLNINKEKITELAKNIMNKANKIFFARDEYINLVQIGESSCLALSKILTEKNTKNIIAMDERTMRMLCEKPENLHKLMGSKLHTKIKANKGEYNFFREFKFIRSAEFIYVAYKKNLINLKDHDVDILDALLYALKFKGCAISGNEIEEIKKVR